MRRIEPSLAITAADMDRQPMAAPIYSKAFDVAVHFVKRLMGVAKAELLQQFFSAQHDLTLSVVAFPQDKGQGRGKYLNVFLIEPITNVIVSEISGDIWSLQGVAGFYDMRAGAHFNHHFWKDIEFEIHGVTDPIAKHKLQEVMGWRNV
jgi:hypothetical protein